jgi:AcrR family transcriptional regulator
MARTVNPARRQAKRQQIIDGAAVLFATQGFDGTTTAQICRATGMSSGNLFHYFASKRDIFVAVITHDEDEKAAQLAAAQARDDPWAALLDVVDLLVAPATYELGPPLVMEAMVQAQRDPDLAAWLTRDQANEQAVIEELVARAIDARVIDPGMAARGVASWISAMIGALYLQAMSDPEFRPADQVPVLRVMLERFLRAAPGGGRRV